MERIVRDLADTHISVGKALADLREKLTVEAANLSEIQQAIALESARLKEIHDIDAAAVSLKALLEVQSERKITFESDMEERRRALDAEMDLLRQSWKKEQAEHEQSVKERDAAAKKGREREEEEYQYQLTQKRKKEKDAQAEEAAAFRRGLGEEREKQERELRTRIAAMTAQESEVADLKRRVEGFPAEMASAIKNAEESTKSAALREIESQRVLREKEIEGERKVLELKIATLQDVVAKQSAQIEALTKQLSGATAQVQQIAVKAIEGASGVRTFAALNEMVNEQARKAVQK